MARNSKLLHPPFLFALTALVALPGCVSTTESAGQERVFPVRYETVAKIVWSLPPNPAADSRFEGHDVVEDQSYELTIPESVLGPVSGTTTDVYVSKIDAKTTRVEIETTKAGFFLDTRERQTEQRRMEELARLLNKLSK
jgi:hypothetical protein